MRVYRNSANSREGSIAGEEMVAVVVEESIRWFAADGCREDTSRMACKSSSGIASGVRNNAAVESSMIGYSGCIDDEYNASSASTVGRGGRENALRELSRSA